MADKKLTRQQIRAVALASAGFYAVVVAYVGFAFLSGVVATAAYVMAAGGAIVTYIVLEYVYRSMYDTSDEDEKPQHGKAR